MQTKGYEGVNMKIVILDGYTANPGDLAWKGLEALGELTVYDRTKADETVARAADAEVVLTNKVIISRVLTKCQTLCEKGQRKDMNETR